MKSIPNDLICPICSGKDLRTIYSDRIPLHTHMLFPEKDDPRLSVSVPIQIACCDECLHGFHGTGNADELAQEYYASGEYRVPYFGKENSGRISWAANAVMDLHRSHGVKTVLELGCGMGEVLTRLADAGLECVGIDLNPATNEIPQRPNLTTKCLDVSDYDPKIRFDLILARLFLEHVDQPRSLLERFSAFSTANGFLVLEVPHATETIKAGRFSDYYHEHRQYYSVFSIKKLLAKVGWVVNELRFNRGQTVMIVIAQRSDHIPQNNFSPDGLALSVNVGTAMDQLVNRFDAAGSSLWWGAGFTGARLLNSMPPRVWGKITLLDGDPQKQNRYVPVCKVKVMAPPEKFNKSFKFGFIASITSAPEIKKILRRRGYRGPLMCLAAEGKNLFTKV